MEQTFLTPFSTPFSVSRGICCSSVVSLVEAVGLPGEGSVAIVTSVSLVTESLLVLSPELVSCQDGSTGELAGTGGNCRLNITIKVNWSNKVELYL